MNLTDWIILLLVGAMLHGAFRVLRGNKKKGKIGCCSSCNGTCAGCAHKANG